MTESSHAIYAERSTVGALSTLATMLVDVKRGYQEVENRSEASLLPVVRELRERHERDAAEVLLLLENAGGRPEAAGSLMGTVHETVATVRDWFGGLDASALDAIIEGEEVVLGQYDTALGALEHMHALRDVIARQKQELKQAVQELKAKQSMA